MKTKFSKKVLALVLTLALVVPMFVLTTSAADKTVSFTLGSDLDESATHADGNAAETYTETVDGYTLSITDGVKMYTGANDEMGNGCIKLGTSSAVGSFSFTVPDDVTSVVLHVAKYKAKDTQVSVNGTAYTISTSSNDGAYTEITVDTTTTKTVSFTTVSGKCRAMLSQIDFIVPDTGAPSISISGNNIVSIDDTITLSAELTNFSDDVSTSDVVWTSSEESVATVEGGVVTGMAMGTTTITATVGEVSQTKEITVYPAAGTITIAEALDIAEFVGSTTSPYKYTVVGTVDSIDTAWSEQYNNICVTISDDTGSIYVYRMNGGETLQVGQKIAVSGNLMTYGSSAQFAQYSEYELVVDDSTQAIIDALNALEAKMSLAYQYNKETTTEEVEVTTEVTDTLNKALTGVGTSGYSNWNDVTATSSAVFAGNSCGTTNDYIQLRSSNSTSGIVTTTSGGKVKSITVNWYSTTTSGRTIDIYGSNTAYTAASDLYDSTKQGTKLGSIVCGTSTSLTIDGDYEYIGIRSASGALYLTSVEITWAVAGEEGATEEKEVTTYSDSKFVIRCGVDAGLVGIEGVESYGIKVTAGGKSVVYNAENAASWVEDDTLCYLTLNLGDIINDTAKLGTEFTVQAVVTVDGIEYVSTSVKTYSVATMIAEYNGVEGVDVSDLYNYLVEKGLI